MSQPRPWSFIHSVAKYQGERTETGSTMPTPLVVTSAPSKTSGSAATTVAIASRCVVREGTGRAASWFMSFRSTDLQVGGSYCADLEVGTTSRQCAVSGKGPLYLTVCIK